MIAEILTKTGVVTANDRIGVMGFMAQPALSGESSHHPSGNYGLLDALMALQWIQDNARQFGGDPRRVTLFGQSSGSFDVQVLMASPLSKGLFHAEIAESGQMTSFAGAQVPGIGCLGRRGDGSGEHNRADGGSRDRHLSPPHRRCSSGGTGRPAAW